MWVLLSFFAAVFTAFLDISNKNILKKVDVYIVVWAWWAFSVPFLFLYFIYDSSFSVGPQFFPTLLLEMPLIMVAVIYYVKALKESDLSTSVPMLTFTPLFLLITSPVILKEFPHPMGIVGVIFIVIGSYVLFIQEERSGWLKPFQSLINHKGARYMLAVAILFSITGAFDKKGVLNSSPVIWMLTISFILSLALTVLMFIKSRDIGVQVRAFLPVFTLIGLFNATALILQMTAFKMTLIPYVIAIKRTSVIMAALYGFIFLKEKGFKKRIAGIILMVIGVFMISFS